MFRPNAIVLGAMTLAVVVLLAGAALLKGGLHINRHEGDAVHLVEIVLRMAQGDWPQRDLMTPIGPLAFAPMVLFVEAGLGIGQSILWGQVLAAVPVALAAWWVAATRMESGAAFLFCIVVPVLMLALVHGEAQPVVSISMHYNRWAWALSFLAIAAALLPPVDRGTGTVDGIVVGLSMAGLALIKVTYFAAFALPVLLALILTGQRRALVVAVAAGLLVAALVTLFLGFGYWGAYVADLREVAASELRPYPSLSLSGVITAPSYLGASVTALAAVVFLRQAGADTAGLILFLLLPGFVYVTFQNSGNDPKWLLLLAVLMLTLKPAGEGRNGFGLPHRTALAGTAAVALAFVAPTFLNLAYSPLRHYATDPASYVPFLPRGGVHRDLLATSERALRTDIRVPLDAPDVGLSAFRDAEGRETPVTFLGETRAYCTLHAGMLAVFDATARDLEAAGLAGRRIFTADLFNPFWLFGDLAPLPGGAPWYYGGLPGYDAAEFLLVPSCPIIPDLQAQILRAVEARGADDLTEVRRSSLFTLYRIGAEEPPGPPVSPDPGVEPPEALPRAAEEAARGTVGPQVDSETAAAIADMVDEAAEDQPSGGGSVPPTR